MSSPEHLTALTLAIYCSEMCLRSCVTGSRNSSFQSRQHTHLENGRSRVEVEVDGLERQLVRVLHF